MRIASVNLYLLAGLFLIGAFAGQWAFGASLRGPGWVILDIVLALGCGLAAFVSWRRATRGQQPFWRHVQRAWRDDHAVQAFISAGRLLGLSGAILLATAVTAAHRWNQLQQNWDRALPFGVLTLIFLGSGTPEATRRWVLPGLGVIAAVLITLPFGEHAHGAWAMFIAALGLLAFGGILLPMWLAEAEKDKAHKVQAWKFPTILVLAGVIVGQAILVFLKRGGLAPAGWWGLGVLVSGVLATAWEVRGVNLEIRKTGQSALSPPAGSHRAN